MRARHRWRTIPLRDMRVNRHLLQLRGCGHPLRLKQIRPHLFTHHDQSIYPSYLKHLPSLTSGIRSLFPSTPTKSKTRAGEPASYGRAATPRTCGATRWPSPRSWMPRMRRPCWAGRRQDGSRGARRRGRWTTMSSARGARSLSWV